MNERDGLATRFTEHRDHLQAIAYRMLGSLSEAEDAVQEAWLRLARTDSGEIGNLAAWLRTVVSRICLDMLRSRTARREEPLDGPLTGELAPRQLRHSQLGHSQLQPGEPGQAGHGPGGDPEQEAILADSVGRALLVVLDTLVPAERIAFVLHDMFAVPFDEIAPIVERSAATTKKLASRARHKVRGTPVAGPAELARHRRVVEAFLAAARVGDLDAILAVLDPGVVRRADRVVLPAGRPTEARGADTVAKEIALFGSAARFAEVALVNGAVGAVVAPRGRLRLVIAVTVGGDRITSYELIADPDRLRRLDLATLAG
jgi:RNA polymerase sigma-70 factor (ECF subfamily)